MLLGSTGVKAALKHVGEIDPLWRRRERGSLRLSFSLIKDDRRFNGVREVRHFHTKVNNVFVGADLMRPGDVAKSYNMIMVRYKC